MYLLNAAAIWLQPAVMNFDVLPNLGLCVDRIVFRMVILQVGSGFQGRIVLGTIL